MGTDGLIWDALRDLLPFLQFKKREEQLFLFWIIRTPIVKTID